MGVLENFSVILSDAITRITSFLVTSVVLTVVIGVIFIGLIIRGAKRIVKLILFIILIIVAMPWIYSVINAITY